MLKNRIPEPIAPKQSAKIVKAPIHIPPKEAAIGIYLLRTSFMEESLYPTIYISYSLSYLATYKKLDWFNTSFGDDPETSIQVLEKTAQVPRMNAVYKTVWIGSKMASEIDLGGET